MCVYMWTLLQYTFCWRKTDTHTHTHTAFVKCQHKSNVSSIHNISEDVGLARLTLQTAHWVVSLCSFDDAPVLFSLSCSNHIVKHELLENHSQSIYLVTEHRTNKDESSLITSNVYLKTNTKPTTRKRHEKIN